MTWLHKYRLPLLFLILLILLSGGYAYYYYSQPRYDASLNERKGYFVASDLKSYAEIGETGILLAGTMRSIDANKEFIIADQVGFQKDYYLLDKPSNLNKGDYNLVDIYATSDKQQRKIKTIDALKIIRSYNSAYITAYGGELVRNQSDGRSLIRVAVKDTSCPIKEYEDRFKLFSVFIDIETEKVLTEEKVTEATSDTTPSYLPLVFKPQVTDLQKKLEKRQIHPNMKDENAWGIKFSQNSKVSDLRLVKEYPDSRKVIKDGGILYTYNNEDTAQAKEIARLLGTEEETDVFQGVTLYGKYSKDGKDHVVQSYDDLMSWYQEPTEEEGAANP